ncbi:hypothetical protein Syn7502_02302 [Synechococcus sp. PCC 7502]|uniref:SIR2 family protein n=1 Tax=Synechococcus sp. PCC 7502 TaxID=1173263 RepID=UPI00029FD7E9|nr:SIR2 family protein [Synechococcus sp. PCC 7502]AFY74305.1 hypothetical protein Syn7502_02302 [Synechococcus sp. PCC 7502]
MIDPMISLAFSIHSNKGVYALLLGSGVSRSAGIPTGWEVVLDLIKKLAVLDNQICDDPAAWYREKFDKEPDYSELLENLAKTPSERSKLLRGYFEPTEEEREEGKKLPTLAHKSIAELVSSGHIKVILTTNFDHLMEDALRAIGIEPTVISTIDAIDGAFPLIHTPCTVIKVNGDYLDSRIRNTPDELAQYDDRLNRLLDRVFDDFGLIVCGWSADYDIALRAAIERCPNRRFTNYWSVRSELREDAKRLINFRKAEVINNYDADSFFQELAEKVSALSEFDKPHPLSAKVAVATLKKYIPEDRYIIRLHDLVQEETEKLHSSLSPDNFPLGIEFGKDEFIKRVKHYESLVEIPLALMAIGCYWGNEKHESIWAKCLERIANPLSYISYSSYCLEWKNLSYYPSLLLFYAGGIAAIAAGRFRNLNILMTQQTNRSVKPLALYLNTYSVINRDTWNQIYGTNFYTPISDHLYDLLRATFQELLPEDSYYQKYFDCFEYLLALTYADLSIKANNSCDWVPMGSFMWRGGIDKEIEMEVKESNSNWAPLKAGMFEGSMQRFQSAKAICDRIIPKSPFI